MKKIGFLALSVLMALFINMTVFAQNGIKVMVYEKEITFQDQGPIIEDGRVLVPIRGVFEKLGKGEASNEFKVSWDEKTSTATIKNKWYTVTIPANASSFTVTTNKWDGTTETKTITPDVPQKIVNGRILIPLRAISEAVSADVDWDSQTNTAKIWYEEKYLIDGKEYTKEEFEQLLQERK